MSGRGKPVRPDGASRPAPRCPICGRPRDLEFRPFCSRRCKQVDLARWMNEVYAVPAADPDSDDEEDPEPGQPRVR